MTTFPRVNRWKKFATARPIASTRRRVRSPEPCAHSLLTSASCQRNTDDLIRAHYDRAAVLVAALFSFLLRWVHHPERFAAPRKPFGTGRSPPSQPALPPPRAVEVEQAIERLRLPAQWTFNGAQVSSFRKAFYRRERSSRNSANDRGPSAGANEWLENRPAITDGNCSHQDPDGDDSATWNGKINTKPTDKGSHPAFIAKLKMKSFGQEPSGLSSLRGWTAPLPSTPMT